MAWYQKLRFPVTPTQLAAAIKKYNVGAFKIAYERLYDLFFDAFYKVDTVSLKRLEHTDVGVAGQAIGNQYQPTGVLMCRRILKRMKKTYAVDGLVDFGSGKAQVLLCGILENYHHVGGVEFSKDLHTIALKNIEQFLKKSKQKPSVNLVCADAREYILHEKENLLYFFHPFKNELFVEVLASLKPQIEKRNTPTYAIYILPRGRKAFDDAPEWQLVDSFWESGYEALVYAFRR